MVYTQLTREQRYQIKALLGIGCTQIDIGQQVGVDKSTISRELRRNRGQRGYRPKQVTVETHTTVYQVKHGLLSDYLRQQLKSPSVHMCLA